MEKLITNLGKTLSKEQQNRIVGGSTGPDVRKRKIIIKNPRSK